MAENIKEQIENKVIDLINAGSGGRLIVVKPEAENMNGDLLVIRKGDYKELPYAFNIKSAIAPIENNMLVTDFFQDEFKADAHYYLIFVVFDEIRQKIIDMLWLVPSLQFQKIGESIIAPDGNKMLRFAVAIDAKEKNNYSPYVVAPDTLGKVIFAILESGVQSK